MMEDSARPREDASRRAYVRLAAVYWLDLSPRIRRRVHRLRQRAQQIPDPTLRAIALQALHGKRSNLEGAAAFAAFAPRERRREAVKALVYFQATCDYLDLLAELAGSEPVRNAERLHSALRAAVTPEGPHSDYYAFCPQQRDAGYLHALIDGCRAALATMPSFPAIAEVVQSLVGDAARFQALNLAEHHGGHTGLARWAAARSWDGAGLYWWEAAAANSTPGALALIGTAGRRGIGADQAVAIAQAYRPWFEALHTLLDSVVDEHEDAASGQRSLLHYYRSPSEAAGRLALMAHEALRRIDALSDAPEHAAMLAAMVGFYLYPAPPTPYGALASEEVLGALGRLATPTKVLFAIKRAPLALAHPHLISHSARGRATGAGRASGGPAVGVGWPDTLQSRSSR
jgi:tetraprenyl-beta-curcumene synthase